MHSVCFEKHNSVRKETREEEKELVKEDDASCLILMRSGNPHWETNSIKGSTN